MDFSKYENNMVYPVKPKKPILCNNHTYQDVKDYALQLEDYEKAFKEYEKRWDEYRKHTYDLENQFRHDALDDVGLLGHKKEGKAYSLAWNRGHSYGLESVYQELCEIADLLLD
jgi:hypothetical protein